MHSVIGHLSMMEKFALSSWIGIAFCLIKFTTPGSNLRFMRGK